MPFPKITEQERIQRLEPPAGRKIRAVMDTDTFNEIDDQFAVVYSLLSPERLVMEAFYAAPFYNELSESPGDGMEKSYRELSKILSLMESEVPSYRGSDRYLPGPDTPVDSEAARNLVERARTASPEEPLYVLAIGAITNVASAILLDPSIIRNIVVVWLGGHSLESRDTKEFNLYQDLHASRLVLDCGVPLVLIPCGGVTTHLTTTLSEVRDYVKGQGKIGDYLYETYKACREDHFGASRVIWDMTTVAYVVEESWTPSTLQHSPRISEDFRWIPDRSRHLIRYVEFISRDDVFRDFFGKLRDYNRSV
ncbi:nucleoside hydrolase [Paenibacillus gansuensis]|uniref:Nucleoside hydrolase n=1 Tax=Paenibacillus gansuensis TaxID=306542 RepID=A0ABW5PGP3_9BACL